MANAGEARLDIVAMAREEVTAVTNKVNANIDALAAKMRTYELANKASTAATAAATKAHAASAAATNASATSVGNLGRGVSDTLAPVSMLKERVSRVVEGFGYWGAAISGAVTLIGGLVGALFSSRKPIETYTIAARDAGAETDRLAAKIAKLTKASDTIAGGLADKRVELLEMMARNAAAVGDVEGAAALKQKAAVAQHSSALEKQTTENVKAGKSIKDLEKARADAQKNLEKIDKQSQETMRVSNAADRDAAQNRLQVVRDDALAIVAETDASLKKAKAGLVLGHAMTEEIRTARENARSGLGLPGELIEEAERPRGGGGGGAASKRAADAERAAAEAKRTAESQQRDREAYLEKRQQREDKLTESSNRFEQAQKDAQDATDALWDTLDARSAEFDENIKQFKTATAVQDIADAFGNVGENIAGMGDAFARVTGNKRIPTFFGEIHKILGQVNGSQKSVKDGAIAGFDALMTLGAGWFKNEREQAAFMAAKELAMGFATLENVPVSVGHFAAAGMFGALAGGAGGGGGGGGGGAGGGGRAAANAQSRGGSGGGGGDGGNTTINVTTLVADKQSINAAVSVAASAGRNNGYARRAGV